MTTNRTAQRWILALTSVGSFLVVLDMLVVATALTTIHRDLGASVEDLEWTVNAYTLSFAVFLMSAATMGDRYGRRGSYAAGLALFAVASAACALSTNVGALVAARTVQGIGAAVVMPLALSLLNAAFPPQQRGRAMGVYGSVTGLAAALGPVVGGAVTQGIAWQWIFWINVPIAVIAIPLVLTRVPTSRVPGLRSTFRASGWPRRRRSAWSGRWSAATRRGGAAPRLSQRWWLGRRPPSPS